jgi:uncharacterized protein (TIGR01777 family)
MGNQSMKIKITGGTGFVGSHLAEHFLRGGHQVTAFGRSSNHPRIRHECFRHISADTTIPGAWQKEFEDADAVVNLAGVTIFKRWTDSYKKLIYDSRVLTTRNVAASLPQERRVVFCSASGVGYYGSREDEVLNEDHGPGNDFLANLSVDWEKEATGAAKKDIRVILMRFGVILGKGGGAMAKMIPAFKLFVGGSMGSGKQWFPWMHLDDLTAAVQFIINNDRIEGAVNFSAPNTIRYRDLARSLADALNRPAIMPAPAILIRLALGEFGNVFLASQRVVPSKLLDHGFSFRYPDISGAVKAVVEA